MNGRRRETRLLVIGAIGVVGTALWYFLDAEHGAERRRVARDWVTSSVRDGWRALGLSAEPAAAEPVDWQALGLSAEPVDARGSTENVFHLPTEASERFEEPMGPPDAGPGAPAEVEAVVPLEVEIKPVPVAAVGSTSPAVVSPPPGVTILRGETGRPPHFIAYESDADGAPPAATELGGPGTIGRQARVADRASWVFPATASLAVVAACAAIGLGVWALVAAGSDTNGTTKAVSSRSADQAQAIALLSEPGTRRIPAAGARGTIVLVVGKSNRAVLVLSSLRPAPSGKTYEAWVVGKNARAAGLFRQGLRGTVVPLTLPVPKGAIVAVTLEPVGGRSQPTGKPFFVAKRT